MARQRGWMVDQRDLVQRASRGDHDAFAELVGGSIAQLEAVARLILRDPELARDAVQEAYIRAWRDLRSLRDPDRFHAWLRRLTINACLDVVRRRKRRPLEVDLDPISPPALGDMTSVVADRDELERAFRRLNPEQRALLVLHYYLGMPVSAIAETLDLPSGTAHSRLHRALESLRGAMAADARSATAHGQVIA